MQSRNAAAPPPLPAKKDEGSLLEFWWWKILMGLLMLGGAVWLDSLFTELETGVRESARINAFVVLLYRTLGHSTTVTIFVVIGALLLIWGILQVINQIRRRFS